MYKSAKLLAVVFLVCALLIGFLVKHFWPHREPETGGQYFSLIDLPIGADNLTNLLTQIKAGRMNPLFGYYVDSNGKYQFLGNFHLEIEDFDAPLVPTVGTNRITLAGSISVSASLGLSGAINANGSGATTNTVSVTIKGKIVHIWPRYTLYLNPTFAVFPPGYVREFIWAEEVDMDNSDAKSSAIIASGSNSSVGIDLRGTGAKVNGQGGHWENVLFARYVQPLEKHRMSRQTNSVAFKPLEKTIFSAVTTKSEGP